MLARSISERFGKKKAPNRMGKGFSTVSEIISEDDQAAVAARKEGYMVKQGGLVKSWKRRWFELRGTSLYYFESESAKDSALGMIHLHHSHNQAVAEVQDITGEMKGHKFMMSIGHKGARVFFLSAESESEKKAWLDAICSAIQLQTGATMRVSVANHSVPVSAAMEQKVKEESALAMIAEQEETKEKIKMEQQQEEAAIAMQAAARGFLQRIRFKKSIQRVIIMQALWRKHTIMKAVVVLKKKAERRKNIAQEILDTERSYVDCLSACDEIFQKPLLASKVPKDMVTVTFSNLSTIIGIHQKLLQSLEERFEEPWHPHLQLGDIFTKINSEFKAYIQYIKGYDKAHRAFQSGLEIPEFAAILLAGKHNERCNLLDLPDFLIMPVQRLPRYVLLLSDLLKHTEEDAKDYKQINEALDKMKISTKAINEEKRQADSLSRIMKIQVKVRNKGKVQQLYEPGRILVREGTLQLVEDKSCTKLYVFLFNDTMLCSKQTNVKKKVIYGESTVRYDYRHYIKLENTKIAEPKEKNDTDFAIVDGSNKTHTFRASTPFEKKAWIADVQAVITELAY